MGPLLEANTFSHEGEGEGYDCGSDVRLRLGLKLELGFKVRVGGLRWCFVFFHYSSFFLFIYSFYLFFFLFLPFYLLLLSS